MSKLNLCRVLCDDCGDTAYFGESVKGFVGGLIYCSSCGFQLIKNKKAVEVD